MNLDKASQIAGELEDEEIMRKMCRAGEPPAQRPGTHDDDFGRFPGVRWERPAVGV